MKKKNRLLAGALCVMLAAMLIVPAAAHGCHGGRGHHSGYRQNVQTTVTVCPYEDCTQAGRHTHNGVTYCGANHAGGYCDGSCPYYQGSASSGVRYGGHHGCHR